MLTYFTKSKKSIKKLERGATDMETMTTKTTTTNVYPDQQTTLGIHPDAYPDRQITLGIHLDAYQDQPRKKSTTTTMNTMTAKTTATGPGNSNWVRHDKYPWSSCNFFRFTNCANSFIQRINLSEVFESLYLQ